jgi:hypothetical protein
MTTSQDVLDCNGPTIDPGREEDGTVPRCEKPDPFAPAWWRLSSGTPDQVCDPNGNALS